MAQGAPRAPSDTDALLHHPDVVRVIRAIMVEFRIQDQDLKDRVADVQERALETTEPGKRPTDVPGWKALVRPTAYNVGREIVRELCTRGKYNDGPTDGADDHARSSRSILEPHECAKIREIVEAVLREQAGGKHTGVILGGIMTGAPPRELAQDTGVPSSQMRKKTSALRELMRNRFVQAGIAIATLGLLAVGGVAGWEHQQQVDLEQSFDANAAPPRDSHRSVEWVPLHDLPPEEKAAILRDKAIGECAAKQWEACANDLDTAKAWDATGEQLPEVQALRKTLNVIFDAKPRWRLR
jgi:hypothetical protein